MFCSKGKGNYRAGLQHVLYYIIDVLMLTIKFEKLLTIAYKKSVFYKSVFYKKVYFITCILPYEIMGNARITPVVGRHHLARIQTLSSGCQNVDPFYVLILLHVFLELRHSALINSCNEGW